MLTTFQFRVILFIFYLYFTRSFFLTWLSRRVQFGRWSSFKKIQWFTESHINFVIFFPLYFTRSFFLTWLSRRVQFGRWPSFKKIQWFTESHINFVIFFPLVALFTQFILDK